MLTPNRGMGVNTAGMWNCQLTAKKSRFVIIGFTLNGEHITNILLNLKVHLNSESYPHDNLIVDFSKNHL